jgi:hypothetical protein
MTYAGSAREPLRYGFYFAQLTPIKNKRFFVCIEILTKLLCDFVLFFVFLTISQITDRSCLVFLSVFFLAKQNSSDQKKKELFLEIFR